jgi:uncharacterized protein (DUF488 family)
MIVNSQFVQFPLMKKHAETRDVGVESLTAVWLKIQVACDVPQCRTVISYRHTSASTFHSTLRNILEDSNLNILRIVSLSF